MAYAMGPIGRGDQATLLHGGICRSIQRSTPHSVNFQKHCQSRSTETPLTQICTPFRRCGDLSSFPHHLPRRQPVPYGSSYGSKVSYSSLSSPPASFSDIAPAFPMDSTAHESTFSAPPESRASEYSPTSGSDSSPPPSNLIPFTAFTAGGKHGLKLITSDCGPRSHGSNSPSPSIDSESQPPTPATLSCSSTESELFTPLSQHESSPIYTSPASFNVPLYATSSRTCGSSQSQAQNAYQGTFPPAVANPAAPTSKSPKRLCPDTSFRFPPVSPTVAPIARSRLESSHPDSPSSSGTSITPRVKITHPYARLYAKNSKEAGAAKRRRMWNHALEKSFFTPQELYVWLRSRSAWWLTIPV